MPGELRLAELIWRYSSFFKKHSTLFATVVRFLKPLLSTFYLDMNKRLIPDATEMFLFLVVGEASIFKMSSSRVMQCVSQKMFN